MENALPDSTILLELANTKMPFGKYQGRLLMDLPEPYLVWFYGKGFPKGKLGEQLQFLYEIKLNGLEGLLKPLKTIRSINHCVSYHWPASCKNPVT